MDHLEGQALILRADAGTEMGTGHLMRCLALAQAWKDSGGRVVFITACRNEHLLERLRQERFDIRLLDRPHPDPGDWDYTKITLDSYPGAWTVLDGYHFDEIYQEKVKKLDHPLLVLDDVAHLERYYADIVLNQNLHADRLHYSCEPHTRLLLGTRYVLLRREFLAWKDWRREIPEVAKRVLVTLGGSDRENYTLKVIHALQQADVSALKATVVIGASNPHADMLQSEIERSSSSIGLTHDTKDMPGLMAWADVAIASTGTTTWELMFLGTPILALVSADNQQALAEELDKHGAGKNLGRASNLTAASLSEATKLLASDMALRAKISKNARQIVDGQGTQRVMAFIREATSPELELRAVRCEDCRMLWEWANDPLARAASFSSEPIAWEDHVKWFEARLSDPNCHYYIVESQEGIPVGQVRFDASVDEAEVSVSIARPFRGCAFGAEGILMASKQLLRETAIARIYAHIKPDNDSSIHTFTKAGYHMDGTMTIKGHRALRMVLDRDEETFESVPH